MSLCRGVGDLHFLSDCQLLTIPGLQNEIVMSCKYSHGVKVKVLLQFNACKRLVIAKDITGSYLISQPFQQNIVIQGTVSPKFRYCALQNCVSLLTVIMYTENCRHLEFWKHRTDTFTGVTDIVS